MKQFKHYFILALKGLAMGSADVVPGVSGGTIAFITGIYEELIDTIKNAPKAFKSLYAKQLSGLPEGPITWGMRIRHFWKALNGNFLVALLSGIGTAFVLLANVVKYALANYPILLNAFFFGLIIASLFIVFPKVKRWSPLAIVLAIVGFGLAWLFPEHVSIQGAATLPNWYMFISAAIAICAMILPGISGSFVLVMMGSYTALLTAVSEFNITTLAIFILGAAIGLLLFSNVLSFLLRRFHDLTVALLMGFILGSLKIIWPWKASTHFDINPEGIPILAQPENVWPSVYTQQTGDSSMLLMTIVAMVVGILLLTLIEVLAKRAK